MALPNTVAAIVPPLPVDPTGADYYFKPELLSTVV